MENKDFYNENRSLQLEPIYYHVEKFFFKQVKKNQQLLSTDFNNKPALFNFYDERIEEVFLTANIFNDDIENLLIVMFWAIYRVWVKKLQACQTVILEFNQIDKNQAIQLFFENLESEDWREFLIGIGTNFEELKSQFHPLV